MTYKIAKTKRSNATNLGFVSIKRMSTADILIIHRHTHKYIYIYIYVYISEGWTNQWHVTFLWLWVFFPHSHTKFIDIHIYIINPTKQATLTIELN